MSDGRARRNLADLQAEAAATRPQLDDIQLGAIVVLEPHRSLRDAAERT